MSFIKAPFGGVSFIIGIILLLAVATPLYVKGREDDDNYKLLLSMFFYGLGFILLCYCSIIVMNLRACKLRKFAYIPYANVTIRLIYLILFAVGITLFETRDQWSDGNHLDIFPGTIVIVTFLVVFFSNESLQFLDCWSESGCFTSFFSKIIPPPNFILPHLDFIK